MITSGANSHPSIKQAGGLRAPPTICCLTSGVIMRLMSRCCCWAWAQAASMAAVMVARAERCKGHMHAQAQTRLSSGTRTHTESQTKQQKLRAWGQKARAPTCAIRMALIRAIYLGPSHALNLSGHQTRTTHVATARNTRRAANDRSSGPGVHGVCMVCARLGSGRGDCSTVPSRSR